MGNRWFNLAVVLLWLASMTWLVASKILPSLLVGDPPSYQDILAAQRNEPPVGWRLIHRGDAIGWALSVTVPLQHELTEIRSRVHFTELPLAELAPGVIGHFLSLTEYGRTKLEMDTESTLLIDSLGCLSRFDSSLRLEGIRDVIRMEGTVEDGGLKLSVRAGEFTHSEQIRSISSDALLGDSLSPQMRLPDLCLGKTWPVPTFSPFGAAAEQLVARVEEKRTMRWNGEDVETWEVVYRGDPGIGLGLGEKVRGRLRVRCEDGAVLQQQVMLLNSHLTFLRMSDEDARALAEEVGIKEMAERR